MNGKTGTVQLNASDVGARPNTWTPTAAAVGAVAKSGDTMTGWLKFVDTVGHEWTTADGTKFAVRAYKNGNLFQITTTPPGGSQHASFNIKNDGSVWLGKALPVESGGTGATNALQALINLGITDSNVKDFAATDAGNWEQQVKEYILANVPNRTPFILNVGFSGKSYGTAIAWKTNTLIFVIIHNKYGTSGTKFWKYDNGAWHNVPVTVDCGGTGATDAATALNNLGANPKIITHSFWADNGKAAAGTFSMVGYHIVTNYGNGLFRVLFHGSSQTIAADTFEYGVRADWLLNNINATFGTSFTGISHKSSAIDAWRYDNGSYAKDGAGFGYCFQERHTSDAFYLVPARVHTSAGNVGQWALNSINNYWGADAMVNYELWLQLS